VRGQAAQERKYGSLYEIKREFFPKLFAQEREEEARRDEQRIREWADAEHKEPTDAQ
jgi:hypothetical protein